MRCYEFNNVLKIQKASATDLVHVIDKNSGKRFTIKGAKLETHEDAGGARTLWIQVEED